MWQLASNALLLAPSWQPWVHVLHNDCFRQHWHLQDKRLTLTMSSAERVPAAPAHLPALHVLPAHQHSSASQTLLLTCDAWTLLASAVLKTTPFLDIRSDLARVQVASIGSNLAGYFGVYHRTLATRLKKAVGATVKELEALTSELKVTYDPQQNRC